MCIKIIGGEYNVHTLPFQKNYSSIGAVWKKTTLNIKHLRVVVSMYILQKRLQFNGAVCVKKETNEVNAEKRRKLNRGSRGRVSESQNTEI